VVPAFLRVEGAIMTRASRLVLMAVSHLLFAAAAEAQGVSFIARTDFGAGSKASSFDIAEYLTSHGSRSLEVRRQLAWQPALRTGAAPGSW